MGALRSPCIKEVARGTAMAGKTKRILRSKTGFSLIETIVAAAILAVAALILVSFVYTLAGVGKRSTDLSEADAELTEAIALHPNNAESSSGMDIALGSTSIATMHNTYTTDNGQFSTFDYEGTP
jgi:prepilin-type N-terminal cleavage/methylation domain-containing protein